MSDEWYVKSESGHSGPYTLAELRKLAKEGRVQPGSMVRRSTDRRWVRSAAVTDLGRSTADIEASAGHRSPADADTSGKSLVRDCPHCHQIIRVAADTSETATKCAGCGKHVKLDNCRVVAHQVFISYSKKDKVTADRICTAVEARGVRCWIAPRDIRAGKEWGSEIIDAIEGSRVMAIVYSAHSNGSQQVLREVERATAKGVVMIPFRIEDVPMSKALEYYLSATQWLDATESSLDANIKVLTSLIGLYIQQRLIAGFPQRPRSKGRRLVRGALMSMIATGLVTVGFWSARLTADPTRDEMTRRLATTIEGSISPDDWESVAGPFSIRAFDGTLVVSASSKAHFEIHQLLNRMRLDRGLDPVPFLRPDDPEVEVRVWEALDENTSVEFLDQPLRDCIDYISDLHGIPIRIDDAALSEFGIDSDEPIVLQQAGVPLRAALDAMLNNEFLDLGYEVREDGLLITTGDAADWDVTPRTFDVRDLTGEFRPEWFPVRDSADDDPGPNWPAGQNPFNQNPFSQNKSGQDPFSQDPFSQDPFLQGPFSDEPTSTNPPATDPFSADAPGNGSTEGLKPIAKKQSAASQPGQK